MPPSQIWQGLWSSVVLNGSWKHRLAGLYEPWHRRARAHPLCTMQSSQCRLVSFSLKVWRVFSVEKTLQWNNTVFLFLYLDNIEVSFQKICTVIANSCLWDIASIWCLTGRYLKTSAHKTKLSTWLDNTVQSKPCFIKDLEPSLSYILSE